MTALSLLCDTARHFWPHTVHSAQDGHAVVARVRRAAEPLKRQSDRNLEGRAREVGHTVRNGVSVTDEEVLLPGFALVLEAARRTIGIELYDVQLLAGLAQARGSIAEMQTGEGKTFAAALPAFLHSLSGRGVHVMTVNPYLAGRDFELLAPAYRVLGASVGLVRADTPMPEKRAAYLCDVTYGPGYEFGFDYLRDQMALLSRRTRRLGEQYLAALHSEAPDEPLRCQRGHFAAVVDEADSVMLDEATTPLILAAGGEQPALNADVYRAAAAVADELTEGKHFLVDRVADTIQLTGSGIERTDAEARRVGRERLDRAWSIYVERALKAAVQLRRDVHYIVRDGAILLVDGNTGRILADRSWREGLQQAVQAKEGVTITTETQSIARITRQRYLRHYKHLCGMTGTARAGQRELRNVYEIGVSAIPLHRPCRRVVFPPRFFSDLAGKEYAVAEEVARVSRTKQPILVGTIDIETSERLARRLDGRNVAYQLLNGKQDAEEAAVIARAGQLGSVTIATNMAGRGTDVKLGPGAGELGGLYVIATEPHESTRVDRQLAGRAARQGDPGSYRLFASAEDRLFARHAPALALRMKRSADESGEIDSDLSREAASLQRTVERRYAAMRRRMFAHDDWLENVMHDLADPA